MSDAMSDTSASTTPSGHVILSSGWSTPENVSNSPVLSSRPVVLVEAARSPGEDRVHVIWEESGSIYYRLRQAGRWSGPSRLAAGLQPAGSLARDGTLHVAYANEFHGQFNVFYVRLRDGTWSLPRLVSRTNGLSSQPTLALDSDGVLHVVWTDTTPGYSALYHGWWDNTWLFEPLLNTRGSAAVLANDPEKQVLHLAWQSRGVLEGAHEIYHSQGRTHAWSLPENISVSPDQESRAVAMVSDGEGVTHLLWQEGQPGPASIHYVKGHTGNWSVPEAISSAGVNASEPAVHVTHGTQLHAVWREGTSVLYRRRSGNAEAWQPSQALLSNDSGLEQMALASEPDGHLHLVWSGWVAAGQKDIYHSRGETGLRPQVFVPGLQVGS